MTLSPFSKSHKQNGHSTIEGKRRVGRALLRRERPFAGDAGTGGRIKAGRKRWTRKGRRANARWASEGDETVFEAETACGKSVVSSSGSS